MQNYFPQLNSLTTAANLKTSYGVIVLLRRLPTHPNISRAGWGIILEKN